MEREKYIEFMYNKDNIMNCSDCPENCGQKSTDSEPRRKPCGQYNCWVKAHCDSTK